MRPLRALATLAALVLVWGGWRFDAARATYASWVAADAARMRGSPRIELASASKQYPTGSLSTADVVMVSGSNWRLVRARRQQLAETELGSSAMPPVDRKTPRSGSDAFATNAYALADAAYASLARGDRRAAAESLIAALAADSNHPSAAAWRAQLVELRRRWSFEGYSLVRSGGSVALASSQPLFGGGQSGLRVGYTFDPLARKPLDVFGRFNIAQDGLRFDSGSTQAGIGIGWRPLGRSGPYLAAERLLAVGTNARNAWTLRISDGAAHAADTRIPLDVGIYGEASVIGVNRRDIAAGAQAYALYPFLAGERTRLASGLSSWGGWQHGADDIARLDIGPSVVLTRRIGAGSVELRADYRVRVAGDAAPGSGPAVTVVARY